LRNITERKKAEDKLRENKEFIENLVESLRDGLSVINPDGARIMVNKTLCDITGFSKEELVGSAPPFPIWPPEHMKELQEAFGSMRKGTLRETELTFMRKNGERFPVLISPSYMRDEKGEIIYFIVTIKDITERKRAEEALRESEQKYRTLAEASQDMIFIVDREDRIQYANSFAAKQFRSAPEALIGKPRKELFTSDVADRQQQSLKKVFETGEAVYAENKTPFSGREIWLDTWLVPLKNEKGEVNAVLGISRDITARKQAEDLIKKHAEVLEEANRLKDLFTDIMSHDLLNPVSIIRGFAQMLSEETDAKNKKTLLTK